MEGGKEGGGREGRREEGGKEERYGQGGMRGDKDTVNYEQDCDKRLSPRAVRPGSTLIRVSLHRR